MPNDLSFLIGIKDCRFVSWEEKITDKGRRYSLFNLEYDGFYQTVCPICGKKMYKHGKRHVVINDTPMNGMPHVLDIYFYRMRCGSCGEMWSPKIEDIEEKRRITQRALVDITDKCLRNTFEDISNDYLITGETASNIFEDFLDENADKLRFKTPVFLGIDEIKIKRLGEITVITDIEHRTLFDILPERNQEALSKYFENLPDRETVLWVCTDMYRPFQKPIAAALPNARWAIDHCHLVGYANMALDSVRKTIQDTLGKKARIHTKKKLAYTLRKRLKDLDAEDAEKIALIRTKPKMAPMAIAFDLKEDFFNIYDENLSSIDNAKRAFEEWEQSIPADALYEPFRNLAKTVHNFYEQIFNFWECPIAVSNGFTECMNRLIRENNCRGRGYSFKILRGRSLYRKTNIQNALMGGQIIGPTLTENEAPFHFDSTKDDDDDFIEINGELVDESTGEIMQSPDIEDSNQ